MNRKRKNQKDDVQSKIMMVSAKRIPVWKVLISWVGLGIAFYISTQLLRGVLANALLCFGMIGVLTFQYGVGSLSSLFGRMKKGTKRWMLVYLVLGFAVPLVLALIINPNFTSHARVSSINQLSLLAQSVSCSKKNALFLLCIY